MNEKKFGTKSSTPINQAMDGMAQWNTPTNPARLMYKSHDFSITTRVPYIPRQIIWCNLPGASRRLFRGITDA